MSFPGGGKGMWAVGTQAGLERVVHFGVVPWNQMRPYTPTPLRLCHGFARIQGHQCCRGVEGRLRWEAWGQVPAV